MLNKWRLYLLCLLVVFWVTKPIANVTLTSSLATRTHAPRGSEDVVILQVKLSSDSNDGDTITKFLVENT